MVPVVLELTTLLVPPPECWDYTGIPPFPAHPVCLESASNHKHDGLVGGVGWEGQALGLVGTTGWLWETGWLAGEGVAVLCTGVIEDAVGGRLTQI